jgi:hypothetical protein
MALYPATIKLQPNTYLTYFINSPTGTFSISPSLASQNLNATLNTTTGRLIFNPQGYFPGTINPFTITNVPNPSSNVTVNFLTSLNNTFNLLANQAVSFSPNYAAVPPGTVTYSLYTLDVTDGQYVQSFETSLPPGLSLNASTGVISGTTTAFSISPLRNYQIQINNPATGRSYTVIRISVDILPAFSYPDSPYIYKVGDTVNIVPNILSSAIGTTFSIAPGTPGLPDGLVLSFTSGVISGVALNSGISDTIYTIRAIPSSGYIAAAFTTTLRIVINKAVTFSYPGSPYVLTQNEYASIVPSNYASSQTGQSTVPTVQGWTILPAVKPNINLFDTASGYDTFNKRVIFATSQPTPNSLLYFKPNTKTFTNPQLAVAPSARFGTNFCLIPGETTGVLFSRLIQFALNTTGVPVFDDTYYNDTWLYSTSTSAWTNVSSQTNGASPNVILPAYAMSTNQQVLVFGGFVNYPSTFSSDTYLFDIPTLTWTQITPTPGPLPFGFGNSMVFYPPTNSFILVESTTDQTWSFQGSTWTLLSPAASPVGIKYPLYMVYVSSDNCIYALSAVNNDDTTWQLWKYNGTWTQIVTTSTPYGYGGSSDNLISMVYVSDLDKIYVFQPTAVFAYTVSTQTWNLVNNTLPTSPSLQPVNLAAVNTVQNALNYLFSPDIQSATIAPTVPAPTNTFNYLLSTNAWSRYNTMPQPKIINAGTCYDSLRNVYWLLNGENSVTIPFNYVNQLWKFDNSTKLWSQVTPLTTGPIDKKYPNVVYDTLADKVVLYGGSSSETWVYDPDANVWTLVPFVGSQPGIRVNSSFVYNPDTNTSILFGGEIVSNLQNLIVTNDVWSFDAVTLRWTQLSVDSASSGPPQSAQVTMAYNTTNKAFVLFFGSRLTTAVGVDNFPQTWYLQLPRNGKPITWTRLNVTNPYQCYVDALVDTWPRAMLFDATSNTMTLFTVSCNYELSLSTVTPDPQPIGVTYKIICNVTPGAIATYQVPPRGMTFDSTTGIISGTPTVLQPPFQYEVQATNTAGTTTAYLIISVVKPYTGGREFTLCQDDIPDFQMRHKAEVLQHRGNALQLSRAQRLARAVTGRGEWGKRVWATQGINFADPNTQRLPLVAASLLCPSNPIVCAPNYFSDVPGPVMDLCQNQALPPVPFRTIRQYTNNGSKWPQITTKQPEN